MKRIFLILFLVLLAAASCNPFKKPSVGGVVKTVNGGADWLPANAVKNNANASISGLSFGRIGLDPQNREVVYAGSLSGGFFRSIDSAGSWERILSKIFVHDFAVNPANPQIIYVAGYYGDVGKVIKTTDAGATWQEAFNGEQAGVSVWSIALNPQNPNQLLIGLSNGSLIKSEDGGLSWRLVKNLNDRINQIIWQPGGIYVLGKTGGLLQSSSTLDSFAALSGMLLPSQTALYAYNSQTVASFNQMYVDPLAPNLIYLATDKGLYKTTDGGRTWQILNLPVKPDQYGVRSIAVAKASSNIIFTSVGSTIYKSADGGGNWQTQQIVSGNLVYSVILDPQQPQIAYASIYILDQ